MFMISVHKSCTFFQHFAEYRKSVQKSTEYIIPPNSDSSAFLPPPRARETRAALAKNGEATSLGDVVGRPCGAIDVCRVAGDVCRVAGRRLSRAGDVLS